MQLLKACGPPSWRGIGTLLMQLLRQGLGSRISASMAAPEGWRLEWPHDRWQDDFDGEKEYGGRAPAPFFRGFVRPNRTPQQEILVVFVPNRLLSALGRSLLMTSQFWNASDCDQTIGGWHPAPLVRHNWSGSHESSA